MVKPNIIIIGAGPAGASCSIYLKRFNYRVKIIDAGGDIKGRTSMATGINNFIGLEGRPNGKKLLRKIKKQLDFYGVDFVNDEVIGVGKKSDIFYVYTKLGRVFKCDYLVIAVGLVDKMPPIEGLGPYFDHSIFHCSTCDWHENRNKKTAIVAVDDYGLKLAREIAYMKKPPLLSVIPSKKDFDFSKQIVSALKKMDVLVYFSKISELVGREGFLKEIILDDGQRVEAEVIFTTLGYERLDGFLQKGNANPQRNDEGFIVVNHRNYRSSIDRMYAIGPCNDGVDQAIIAGGQGATAALDIHVGILNEEFGEKEL
ncbi:MAG: Thioredoxin reductase [candidate division WS2 bacterium ADurb.Bin280]|uniref:Thioredoxin reductase n=1 Tax=candidate division WS2 bacterium ADurb.Bin280 TaxID=1852829 RepID=A0A1V5SCL1_9BACT|nr:MAG: Thioredoxin reductase [candidate division WS2 bacterium ADurb.Bin280]